MPNFIAAALRGAYLQICEILCFVTFYCPVLVILFLLQLRSGQTPGRILTVYGLNDALSPNDVPFGV